MCLELLCFLAVGGGVATETDEVKEAHAGSRSRWALTPMSDRPVLREALREAGYREGHAHFAYAVDPSEHARQVPDDVEVRKVGSVEALRVLYAIRDEVFGRDPGLSEEDLRRELKDCTGINRRVARFVGYLDGQPAGAGGLTFFEDLSFGLIWVGGVREVHRLMIDHISS